METAQPDEMVNYDGMVISRQHAEAEDVRKVVLAALYGHARPAPSGAPTLRPRL